MSNGMKMAASALVAAALTAALFLTFGGGGAAPDQPPAPPSDTPTDPSSVSPDEPPPLTDTAPPSNFTSWVKQLDRFGGDGTITVHVVAEDGSPVAGVVVTSYPLPAGHVGAAPSERTYEEAMREALLYAHRRESGRRSATTVEDGTCRLTGLGDTRHYVRAFAEGYSIRTARGQSSGPFATGATVNLTAKAICNVRFEVTNLDPDPELRVTIVHAPERDDLGRAGGYSWSAKHPVLSLPPGTGWVQARQGRRPAVRISDPVQINLEPGMPERTVALPLIEQPGLRGRLVSKEGLILRNVSVYALPIEGDEPPKLTRMSSRSAERASFDPRDGTYAFPEIHPGRWFVWVTLGGRRESGSAIVDVRDRMVDQDIEVTIDDPKRFVTVRVVGPDGKPFSARDVRFSTSFQGSKIGISGGGTAIPLEDGSWLVSQDDNAPAPGEDPGGTYRIRVTHEKLGFLERPYDPVKERTLEFRFAAAASVVVTMRGLKASRLGLTMSLRQHMDEKGIGLTGSGTAPAGETFTFDRAQPGEWMLLLVCHQPMMQVARRTVTLREGDNRIDWPFAAVHEVTVDTPEGVSVGSITVRGLDDAGAWVQQYARAEANKPTVLRHLPPGRYELSTTVEGKPRRLTIQVPAQTRVRLE